MSSVGNQKGDTIPEAPLLDSVIPTENAEGQARVKSSPESSSLEEQLLENMKLKPTVLGKKNEIKEGFSLEISRQAWKICFNLTKPPLCLY